MEELGRSDLNPCKMAVGVPYKKSDEREKSLGTDKKPTRNRRDPSKWRLLHTLHALEICLTKTMDRLKRL